MLDSPTDDTIIKEICPALYRPLTGGEEEPHEHRVRKITRKQVYIERIAEDGSSPLSDVDPDGQWVLSLAELVGQR